MTRHAFALGAALLLAGWARGKSEEGARDTYFNGDIEVIAEGSEDLPLTWLESPLWSEDGRYLLFSDVKWQDSQGRTTGMIWRWDEQNGVTEFLKQAGVVGPGSPPANIGELAEAGPNGMIWSWDGYPNLLLAQHGMKRIVQFSVADVSDGSVMAEKVSVVAASFDGAQLNSPNDLTMIDGTVLFTDPPYGLQHRGDNGLEPAYGRMTQPSTDVYALSSASADPVKALADHWRPNGIAVSSAGKVFIAHTDFDEPGYSVYGTVGGDFKRIDKSSQQRFNVTHRIDEQANAGLPALFDGMTAYKDVVFAAGPGGVYVLDGESGEELAFLRIDDLVSNVGVGGGYLWITANRRLLRIKLADEASTTDDEPTTSTDEAGLANFAERSRGALLTVASCVLVGALACHRGSA